MKNLAKVLTFAVLFAGVAVLNGHGQPASRAEQAKAAPPKAERQKLDPGKVKELMHKKLELAQRLLAALVLNNVDQVGPQAQGMIQLSNEAEWKVFKTAQYEMNSNDFRRSAEKLVQQSKAKDIESAKLTYLELTMTCFHCHRYVRDVGMVRLDDISR